MDLSYITFLLFAAFSSLRMFSYLPQIYRVATDKNGASAISYSTWALWIGANVTTALYAFRNLNDAYLGCVSVVYAGCCMSVILLTMLKRRRHRGSAVRAPKLATTRWQWFGPRWAVALAAVVVIAVGLGARWGLPDLPQLMPGPATAYPAAEVAVADTPFEDEISATKGQATDPIPSAKRAQVTSFPEAQFGSKAPPHGKKGNARSVAP